MDGEPKEPRWWSIRLPKRPKLTSLGEAIPALKEFTGKQLDTIARMASWFEVMKNNPRDSADYQFASGWNKKLQEDVDEDPELKPVATEMREVAVKQGEKILKALEKLQKK